MFYHIRTAQNFSFASLTIALVFPVKEEPLVLLKKLVCQLR